MRQAPRERSRRRDRGVPVDGGTAALVRDPDRADAYTLLLDGAPQSHVDLADPTRLEFEYVRWFSYVLDAVAPAGAPLRMLHLGGGGLTLPRYVAATRPGSPQRVVEIDAALVELVRRELPLRRDCRPRVRVGDAREVLATLRPGSVDAVVVDVYANSRIPAHLTTVEFVAAAERVLADGGVYLANVADGAGLRFTRAQTATVRAVFGEVAVIGDTGVLRGRRYGNLVLIGAHRPLPVEEVARRVAGDPFPTRLTHGPALDRFTGGAPPVTDAATVPAPPAPTGPFER
jgi:hypothetical protein